MTKLRSHWSLRTNRLLVRKFLCGKKNSKSWIFEWHRAFSNLQTLKTLPMQLLTPKMSQKLIFCHEMPKIQISRASRTMPQSTKNFDLVPQVTEVTGTVDTYIVALLSSIPNQRHITHCASWPGTRTHTHTDGQNQQMHKAFSASLRSLTKGNWRACLHWGWNLVTIL